MQRKLIIHTTNKVYHLFFYGGLVVFYQTDSTIGFVNFKAYYCVVSLLLFSHFGTKETDILLSKGLISDLRGISWAIIDQIWLK